MANFLVTGGSRGIGAAICRLAAEKGHDVVVNYASGREAADGVTSDIIAAGRQACAVQADMSVEADVIRLYQEAIGFLGHIDVVVNNAGIIGRTPILEMDIAAARSMLEVNLLAIMSSCREAARHMAKSRGGKGGVIVNVSSSAARTGGFPQHSAYAASKGGVDSLSLALAQELGPEGVRVVPVRPGISKTDMLAASFGFDQAMTNARSTIPLGRAADPSEIAAVIVWLAGPEASFMTGLPIDVSGGK
ncbi:SDR family NAD(P)-dependent oxidoreductase [Vannielia litorea]|uniref:NAD(P)-dependent dehydrogenase, short-chain alcohol dehydrogenase family n=1 Tax=Vannielia litorea TaxID=1217970 RepID=A0A1N6GTE1_9RHOB|nr:SDR family oxidoreductase [Vannielia litorea]SIO10861.1 NAD(P)-dependent dehydrogenase, short-chain alcohol dehydrogenase family [Vannielia litorea]